MMSTASRKVAAVLITLCAPFFSTPEVCAKAGGTITGYVYSAGNKAPLSYANVILVGTRVGAMTLDDGHFEIRDVPAGRYQLKVMMMGFASQQREVIVDAGRAVRLTFSLKETIVSVVPVIEVLGRRPEVDVKSATYRQSATDAEVNTLPVDNIMDVLTLRTGVVKMGEEYHIRGGRANEMQTQIDGVVVDDPLGGGSMSVGRFGASGLDLISGGMDAEYGNAQSAVVEITTKEGGNVFGGELRYMTDDFGRADRTFTNYDNLSLGFGGPTPFKSLRYYVSADASFLDGENTTVEPRVEHKNSIFDWLKARDRMSHRYNLQSKLTWKRSGYKISGEIIAQRSREEEYHHSWNVKGYVRKVYYFQRLVPTGTGQDIYRFGNVTVENSGAWLAAVRDPSQQPNPRSIVVEQLVRDPDTGEQRVKIYPNFRAVDVNGVTLLWDELIGTGDPARRKSWILFEGFQRPFSRFSNFQEDSSYVFFNSAEHTPEVSNNNIQLKLGFNHMISNKLLYTVRVSRLEFHRLRSVDGKSPAQYSSAGLPVTLPNGTYLEGGVSQPTWHTDSDNPYFVTAYDYPAYLNRRSVQYLTRSDITWEGLKHHRVKAGVQVLYNDLDNDERFFPAERRTNAFTGVVQQGLNVNLFHNFNTEGAFYVQDRWEYEGLVANAGMRYELFSTGNRDDLEINNSGIDKRIIKYKHNWSPRLGIAFPISERNKFYFHYGRFTQWPGRQYLFATQDAIGASGPLGNPNLDPELTVAYQAGISHQFTENLVANFVVFNRDIYGLVSSNWVTDDTTGLRSRRFINKTYASSRGLEISLKKTLTHRLGFGAYYTYSFADGVASDADVGRSAGGLTHLPIDELPLDWDQRHTFNMTLQIRDNNAWGASLIYQLGSGLPWTPNDRFARLQDPEAENSRRHPFSHNIDALGSKRFNIYGRDLTLFVEGRNLLDSDIPRPQGDRPTVFPGLEVARMDNGSYLTETGHYGGAYMMDVDDDGLDDFVPVHDPTVWQAHRSWRIGMGVQF